LFLAELSQAGAHGIVLMDEILPPCSLEYNPAERPRFISQTIISCSASSTPPSRFSIYAKSCRMASML
jgi:hypothetical protein